MQDLEVLKIPGVIIRNGQRFNDSRGWLMECFRTDEIERELIPEMAYVSVTLPSVARGPHEHLYQTDYFCFLGTSAFKIYLWDNRKNSITYKKKVTIQANKDEQLIMIIPPGIVHAYENIGNKDGVVLNFPNKLYAGAGKQKKIDEIRHENNSGSLFKMDEQYDHKAANKAKGVT
jgi:dTDP-4-dehydrorhamnose 3,5-epimerase